jgi:hypothetical protein
MVQSFPKELASLRRGEAREASMDAIESITFYSALICLALIATAWLWA